MNKTIISTDILANIQEVLKPYDANQIFILADTNTAQFCVPFLLENNTKLSRKRLLVVADGDENKTIYTAIELWEKMVRMGCNRHSLLLNVGGGMITDLGGFVASTFKRGMDYINISTTLLGAVDAATGGKTGVNFLGLKNEIGVFKPAKQVIIAVDFFKTLDETNLRSGFAEMIKHALISSDKDLQDVLLFDLENIQADALRLLLERNVEIKEQIVSQDPTEKGVRKALNFGHTIGHALESYSYTIRKPILHGYAVLWGCVAELYLSFVKLGFPKEVLLQIMNVMKQYYGRFEFSCKQYDALYELMKHDKKNSTDDINFTLLKDVGKIQLDQHAQKEEIFEAFDFLREN